MDPRNPPPQEDDLEPTAGAARPDADEIEELEDDEEDDDLAHADKGSAVEQP